MGHLEPARALVVQVRQGPLCQISGRGAGRVEPALPLLVQVSGGLGDGDHARVLCWLLTRRPGEGKRLKGGRRRVSWVIADSEPCPRTKRPKFVWSGMEHAEEIVIVTGEDD